MAQTALDEMRAVLGDEVFETVIPYDVRVQDAPFRGKPVVDDAPDSPASVAYRQFADELLAIDVGRALDALGDIVGETTADDLLNRIFAEFCIGK